MIYLDRSTMLLALVWVMFLGVCNPLHAAEEYYFVAANPSLEPGVGYATTLFKLSPTGKRLAHVRTVTTTRQGSEFVRGYEEARVIVVGGYGNPAHMQFDIIHYDDPLRNHQLEIPFGDGWGEPINTYLFMDSKMGPVIGAIEAETGRKSGSPLKTKTVGVTLSGQPVSLSWEEYFNILSTSVPAGLGGYVRPDFLRSYGEVQGEFLLGTSGKGVRAPFKAPDLSALKNKDGIVQPINNSDMRVLTSYEMYDTLGDTPASAYLVFDKASEQWIRLVVEGSKNTIEAFGGYLVFTIGYKPGFLKGAEVPIPDSQSPYFINSRERLNNIERSGKIIIIDIKRNLRRELSVSSADCDILLINDKKIVYRVDSSIYSRTMVSKTFGEPELIVQDPDIVPAIHWAFKERAE